MNTDLMFSSKTAEWETPQPLFNKLDRYYQFQLDPCATEENAKCERFYTEEDDGLSKDWDVPTFMNPPYGRQIGKWVQKACYEAIHNKTIVVCLLPARTDTKWFHMYCMASAKEITFLEGRVKFGNQPSPAPFPSMVVVFDGTDMDYLVTPRLTRYKVADMF